jgi:hypothetical protein
MTNSSGDRNPVELLAEEFIARKRRGEKPNLSEYTQKYPDLAADIRALFPALVLMEDLGDSSLASTGPHAGAPAALTQLGDYRVLREVGRGGMGVVYGWAVPRAGADGGPGPHPFVPSLRFRKNADETRFQPCQVVTTRF